jgi:hypothetical protein
MELPVDDDRVRKTGAWSLASLRIHANNLSSLSVSYDDAMGRSIWLFVLREDGSQWLAGMSYVTVHAKHC